LPDLLGFGREGYSLGKGLAPAVVVTIRPAVRGVREQSLDPEDLAEATG
jgi:hypothetical protein